MNAGSLALLVFGALSLVGLIALAGTGNLTSAVQDTLTSVIVGALTGLGVHVGHTAGGGASNLGELGVLSQSPPPDAGDKGSP